MIKVKIRKTITEKKKDKRPTCSSRDDGKGHGIYHDRKGRFSTKANAASVSVRSPRNKPCKYQGQGKMPGHRFTRVVCGRKDPGDPDKKAKYRCYDGEKIREQEEENLIEPTYPDELKRLGHGMVEESIDRVALDDQKSFDQRWKEFVEETTDEEYQRLKSHICKNLHSMPDLLKFINNLQLANKAELFKQDNKK